MKFGGRLGCHQIPERSFFFRGYQFPICARCTGVYIGQTLAIILVFFVKIQWWISLLFLVPMGIDWGLQFLKILKSDNVRRVFTGFLGGFGLTYIYYYILRAIINLVRSLF